MSVSPGPLTNNSGAILNGTGTLTVSGITFTQSGIINPGESAGNLTVTGNLPNTSSAVINIELGGVVQGTEYDKLTVSGSATLDGTLNITLINGFQPQLGNTFTIMTYGSFAGAFDTITGLDLGGGLVLEPTFNSTSVVLEVVGATGFSGRLRR